MANEDTHFDCLLGGTQTLPSSLLLSKFAACRSQEIQIMKGSLKAQSGTKLAFQALPNHMRRRTMAHNVKRLPRRLRQIHLSQMKKSGLPSQQKRPSRRYRRRPRNLILEYTKRSHRNRWLQTHIWHAKRFHMISKWGYKLPFKPCDKSFRACYRAMNQHCLLQDISYYCCLEVAGKRDVIIDKLKDICRHKRGLSIGARCYRSGNREGEFTLYEFEKGWKPIGNVSLQWCPNESEFTKLWLWVHPAFYETAKMNLNKCFKNVPDIAVVDISTDLCKFRLTGPLSTSVLRDSLVLVSDDTVASSDNSSKVDCWNLIKVASSPAEIPPHTIVSLVVKDPRSNLPRKRTKSLPDLKKRDVAEFPTNLSESELWNSTNRNIANSNKMPDSEVANLHSTMLVPGSDWHEKGCSVPIIVIQRPGNQEFHIGLGSGWDVIIPSTWAKPFWISFIMRGARVGGLREADSMLFEMGRSPLLAPDTSAGETEQIHILNESKDCFFKKPPNKRTNYNKLNITSPFFCNWQLLLKEWDMTGDCDNFVVLRGLKILNAVKVFLTTNEAEVPSCPKNTLIPVKLECEGRGCPTNFAIICLPKSKDEKNTLEPITEDKLQSERKKLRIEHKSLLKTFRKQRKLKLKSLADDSYKETLLKYKKQMRSLWLPEAKTVKNSCCRTIIGFVTKGGFKYSVGKSCGIGYIVSVCLPSLVKHKNTVLFRNTNSRQYWPVKMSVIVE